MEGSLFRTAPRCREMPAAVETNHRRIDYAVLVDLDAKPPFEDEMKTIAGDGGTN